MHTIQMFPEMHFLLAVSRDILDLETTREFSRAQNLSEKEEFHVTVIGRATSDIILQHLDGLSSEEKSRKISRIQELCISYDPRIEARNEAYFIQKDYSSQEDCVLDMRKSIIQVAQIDGLGVFYEKLSAIIPRIFSTPFPHITLYTTSTRTDKKLRGIGIYCEADFQDMKPIRL